MAYEQERQQLLNLIETLFPDNSTEEITPADLRSYLNALAYSVMLKKGDTLPGPNFRPDLVKQVGVKVHSAATLAYGRMSMEQLDANLMCLGTRIFVESPPAGESGEYVVVYDANGPIMVWREATFAGVKVRSKIVPVESDEAAGAGVLEFDPQLPTGYEGPDANGNGASLVRLTVNFVVLFYSALQPMRLANFPNGYPEPGTPAGAAYWREASPPNPVYRASERIKYNLLTFQADDQDYISAGRTYVITDRPTGVETVYAEFDTTESRVCEAARVEGLPGLFRYDLTIDELTPLAGYTNDQAVQAVRSSGQFVATTDQRLLQPQYNRKFELATEPGSGTVFIFRMSGAYKLDTVTDFINLGGASVQVIKKDGNAAAAATGSLQVFNDTVAALSEADKQWFYVRYTLLPADATRPARTVLGFNWLVTQPGLPPVGTGLPTVVVPLPPAGSVYTDAQAIAAIRADLETRTSLTVSGETTNSPGALYLYDPASQDYYEVRGTAAGLRLHRPGPGAGSTVLLENDRLTLSPGLALRLVSEGGTETMDITSSETGTPLFNGQPVAGTPSSGGGIDYTSEVVHTQNVVLTVADLEKSHVLSGNTPLTLTLPAAEAGKRLSVRVDRNSTAVHTVAAAAGQIVDGVASRAMWAQESMQLVGLAGGEWQSTGGRRRPMRGHARRGLNQGFSYGPNGFGQLPMTESVVSGLPLSVSAGGILVRRSGFYTAATYSIFSNAYASQLHEPIVQVGLPGGTMRLVAVGSLVTSGTESNRKFAEGGISTPPFFVAAGEIVELAYYTQEGMTLAADNANTLANISITEILD